MLSGDTQRYELVKTKLLSDTFSLKGVLAVHLSNRQYILIKILRVLDTIKNRFINICVLSTLLKSYFWKISISLPYRRVISFYIISFSFPSVQKTVHHPTTIRIQQVCGLSSFCIWQKLLNVTATQGNLLSVCIKNESAFLYKRMGVINVLAIAPGRARLL